MATSAQVQQLYIALLGRAADKPGLDWWLENINGGERTLEQAAAAFTTSEEFVSTYGSLQGAELVTAVYSNLFERTPSQEEVTYWVNDGRPADQLLAAFLAYASPADQTVINNKVTVAQYYTEAAGSDINLEAAAAIIANVDGSAKSVSDALVNLPVSQATVTASLGELNAANEAVESFLKNLDLNGDGKADNATADASRADLTLTNDGTADAYDAALEAVNTAVDAANGGTTTNWYTLNEAQRDAALAKAKVSLSAAETNAKTDADLAYAAMSAALKTAVTKYEAAQTAQQAAVKVEVKADADLAAAVAKYNVDVGSAAAITFDPTAIDSTAAAAAAVTAFGSLITIDPVKYTASLAAGVTETSKPGVTAVLNALQADLSAEKALATANDNLVTAQTGLDAADGGADDATASNDDDFGDVADTDASEAFDVAVDAPTYNAYLNLKTALTSIQDDIKELNAAATSLDAIEVQVAALKELDDAVTDAVSAIGAAGYDLNNANGKLNLNGDGDYTDVGEFDFSTGLDADQAELYTATYTGGAVTMDDGDMIFVGGFAFNEGASATAGNNGVLEFFVEEGTGTNAGNLVVTFEESVFGSNAAAPEVNEIVLTGLSMDDVVIGSNFITLA